MIQIRSGVFETNSSSTHSLTMCTKEEYQSWKKGETYLSQWLTKEDFVPREQAIEAINKKYPNSITDDMSNEDVEEELRDNEFYSYDSYWSEYLEGFEDEYTTKSGEVIVAFGQYGYDG